ncbi:hypothetical protein QBC47DRAFT_397598 [Echria macrotheca]|uniref:Uncharacterized protein n=1 Tax=Echria macrotheca TaxID=438768 RepID=A0AAJ0FF33_9PEZI|nr:hypothetical protein QBC47DRAFT_397598 [Echria macrotheca]
MSTEQAPPPAPPSVEEPPAYQEQRDDPNEVLQPVNLVMHGRFIYSSPNESAPLYELSRTIHAQGEATTCIEFKRLDYRVRTGADGSPDVAHREKHLYNLMHLPIIFGAGSQMSLQPMTRKGLGDVSLKRSPFPHSGFRASRQMSEHEAEREKKRGRDPRREYHFVVKETKHGFEWLDQEGTAVAHQVVSERDGQIECFLFVSVPLTRRMLDGLVALWCLWVWHQHTKGKQAPKKGWQEVKRIMEKPRDQTGIPRCV